MTYLVVLSGEQILVAENDKCTLLNWQLKRIQRVVRSSLAAETFALSDAADSGVYLTKMLPELLFNDTIAFKLKQ